MSLEPDVAQAIVVPGGSVETEGLSERSPMRLQLFDIDGNPVDVTSAVVQSELFDLTGAEDGYILAFSSVKGKFVPMPLSGTQDS